MEGSGRGDAVGVTVDVMLLLAEQDAVAVDATLLLGVYDAVLDEKGGVEEVTAVPLEPTKLSTDVVLEPTTLLLPSKTKVDGAEGVIFR